MIIIKYLNFGGPTVCTVDAREGRPGFGSRWDRFREINFSEFILVWVSWVISRSDFRYSGTQYREVSNLRSGQLVSSSGTLLILINSKSKICANQNVKDKNKNFIFSQ